MRFFRTSTLGVASYSGRLNVGRRFLWQPLRAARLASSHSSDLLKEGAEVEFVTGGRGFLVEKIKGGWWKVAVNQTEGLDIAGAPLVVKVRTSAFRLPAAQSDAASAGATSSSSSSSSPASELEAALAELTGPADSPAVPALYALPTIEAPPRHAATRKWVVFSDLHVKGSSMDSCAEVLHQVHEAALARDAGIIFLGDFWHVRGALNVELLNRVLRSLRQWTQPVIMIPGNHDQVTLGGAVHALEPLMYAFRPDQVLLISEPAVCLGALWIPYRRDPQLMSSILRAGEAASPDRVGIIFCHADVRGAYMNDGMRSRDGLDISSFPPGLPIYSGHFHKPHTMTKGRSSLRYVGSPYQTSLSEAGQDKFLYTMAYTPAESNFFGSSTAAPVWKEQERWALDVGKKYFKAVNVSDPSVDKAKRGDRVVLPVRIGDDAAAEAILQNLKSRGVEVELRRERLERPMGMAGARAAAAAAASGADAGQKGPADAGLLDASPAVMRDPLELFAAFMGTSFARDTTAVTAMTNATSSATTPATASPQLIAADDAQNASAKLALHEAVLRQGRETLLRLMDTEAGAGAGSRIAGSKVCELRFESVQLSNFGPFGGERVTYPLSQRGLVLIRGQSTDGTGADSNGAGKTTLAMSVMWGLTGSMDTRLVADGKAVDVAYDTGASSVLGSGAGGPKRVAEVIVRGQINSKPFELIRRRGARKADLSFSVDGKDLTTMAIKDTQAVIDETLGIGNGLLQRCCFFGQHSHTLQSLLGLTDVRLKSELSCLVDTELWTMSAADVRGRERADKNRLSEISVELRVRGEELERCQAAAAGARTAVGEIEAQLDGARKAVLVELGRSRTALTERFGNSSAAELAAQVAEIQRSSESFRIETLEPLRTAVLEAVRKHGTALAGIDQANSTLRERVSQFRASSLAARNALAMLQNKTRQLDLQGRALELNLRNLTMQYASAARHSSIPGLAAGAASPIAGTALSLSPDAISVDDTRRAHEEALLALANLDARIDAANASLSNLRADAAAAAAAAAGAVESSCTDTTHAHAHAHAHAKVKPQSASSEQCPTCGQALTPSLREARESELQAELASLQAARGTQLAVADDLRAAVDLALQVSQAREQFAALGTRRAELEGEVETQESTRKAKDDETTKLERELALKTVERAELEREWRRSEGDKEREAGAAAERMAEMQGREGSLRRKLDELRSAEASATSQQGQINATATLFEDRLKQARDKQTTQAEELRAIEAVMEALRLQEREIAARGLVLERLGEVLGPRGIQHFVFMSVLKQLETIANSYLQVLADGGVQLTLQSQGDDDQMADRIVKAVWVRAADGSMRERGLSQLSGGQWRRVSMALDLAFAEIIRRRGTLRSNLIVMDEVLTHLDASGREAVGSVLRAMVDGPRAGEAWPDVDDEGEAAKGEREGEGGEGKKAGGGGEVQKRESLLSEDLSRALLGGGAYETAIVILQDLSAMELEEAFDHVDIVVKASDTSKVMIDGLPPAR